jgi:hypothetical protein
MSTHPDSVFPAPAATHTGVDEFGHPVAVEAVPASPVVERVVVAEPAAHGRAVTAYGRRYAFDSFVVGLVGLALTIVGLVAVTRAGFDGPMNDPVVDVLGFSHTVTLGLIEAGLGIVLLICAVTTSRPGALFFGLVMGIGAFVAAVQPGSFDESLAIESSFAWLLVVAAAVVVLVSLLVPRIITRTARVESL